MWLKEEIFSNWGRFLPPHCSGFFPLYFWDLASWYHLDFTVLYPPWQFPKGPRCSCCCCHQCLQASFLETSSTHFITKLFVKGICFSLLKIHIFFPPSLRKPHLRSWSFLFVLHYFCFSLECSLWKCEQTAQKPICMVWGCVSNI